MIIGNDIVDLEGNTPHPRFFARITSEQEKCVYNSSILNAHKLWAIKEAAYKAWKQAIPDLPGVARRFEVQANFTRVAYQDLTLSVQLIQTQDYIFANCFPHDSRPVYQIQQIQEDDDASEQVRSLAIKKVKELVPENTPVHITQDHSRVPRINLHTKSRPLSLTHHGRFIAASFIL